MYTFPKAKNVREIQIGVSNRIFKKRDGIQSEDLSRGFYSNMEIK